MIYREAFTVRPSTRSPEVKESLWDRRFYLGKLQDYSVNSPRGAKTDRPRTRFLLSPILSPRTSRRPSRHPLTPRTPSNKPSIPWGRVTTRTNPLPTRKNSDKGLLSTEDMVTAAVIEREELLDRLKNLNINSGNEQNIRKNVLDILREIQWISIEVTAKIEKLTQKNGSEKAFKWQGRNYLYKMKSDLEDIQQTAVGKYMPDVTNDPMLLRAIGDTFTRLRSDSNPVPSAAQLIQAESRILQAVLSVEDDEICRLSWENSEYLPSNLTHYPADLNTFNKKLALEMVEKMIGDLVLPLCPGICYEACIEWEKAHLTLHSNRIVDEIVRAALEMEIPQCAHEAYTEEVDREFIAFQKEILETVVSREVESSVNSWALEVAVEEIAQEISDSVDVYELVLEAVTEEQEDSRALLEAIFSEIMGKYLSEDWLEIVCEDEFSEALMESRVKDLPNRVLTHAQVNEKAGERIYRDMLDLYVAGIWLELLVRSMVYPESPLLELMPLSAVTKRGFRGRR